MCVAGTVYLKHIFLSWYLYLFLELENVFLPNHSFVLFVWKWCFPFYRHNSQGESVWESILWSVLWIMDKQKVLYFQKETQQEKKNYILEYLECSEGSTLLRIWYPQVRSVVGTRPFTNCLAYPEAHSPSLGGSLCLHALHAHAMNIFPALRT